MTDLVSQLVGALEGMLALDDENHQRYPGDEDVCKEVQAAQAALTAAKEGGWVAVQNKPAAYRVDWPVEAGVGMRRFYGADEWESSRGTVEFLGGVPVPLAPLPTPPKEQA